MSAPTFTRPVFQPVQGSSLELSVSAQDLLQGDQRHNLGAVVFDIAARKLVFVPNNIKTGGDDAARQVALWIDEKWNDLLNRLIQGLESRPHSLEHRYVLPLRQALRK